MPNCRLQAHVNEPPNKLLGLCTEPMQTPKTHKARPLRAAAGTGTIATPHVGRSSLERDIARTPPVPHNLEAARSVVAAVDTHHIRGLAPTRSGSHKPSLLLLLPLRLPPLRKSRPPQHPSLHPALPRIRDNIPSNTGP